MRKRLIFLFFAWAFLWAPLAGAAEKVVSVTAEARVLKSKVKIGDEMHLLLQVEHPRKYTVTPPGEKLNLAPFEIKSIEPKPVIKGQNRVQETFRLTLTVFQTGDLKVPPIAVDYTDGDGNPGRTHTEPVPMKVLSVGKKLTDKDDIRAIKGPVSVGLLRFWNGLLGMLAAGLFIFLVVTVTLRKLREREGLESLKPPHERVKIELARLKDKGFLEERNTKAFYSELSDILRRYLERRFQIEALEKTSPELLAELDKRSFDKQIRVDIGEVLKESDLVKFAKFAPGYELAGKLESLVLDVVEKTKQADRHPEEPKATKDLDSSPLRGSE